MKHTVWDDVVGQPQASRFLRAAAEAGKVSHAYLFVGPPGSGKKTAATALACSLMCADACGSCAACGRVRRETHPDVHVVAPEGAAGYLVDQVQEIIKDVWLAPIDGDWKIYIVADADLLGDSAANAFLKTLEEPPSDVVMILMAHSFDAVLPTIASRCQVVRFRRIPHTDAVELLMGLSGVDRSEAVSALAATGGVMTRARDFLISTERRAARASILRTLKDLLVMDEADVLDAARELLLKVKAPLEQVKADQDAQMEEQARYLAAGVLAEVAKRNKRALTAREREGVTELFNIAESWLRDCLVLSQGMGDLVANVDDADAMEEVAATITPTAVAEALRAVNEARRRISYNVSPQLAVEVMLFDVREVLRCPR